MVASSTVDSGLTVANRRSRRGRRSKGGKAPVLTVARVSQMIKSTLGQRIEQKRYLRNVGYNNVDNTGTTFPPQFLSGIAQGVDVGQRVGDTINGIQLIIRYTCVTPGALIIGQASSVRVLIFRWLDDDPTGGLAVNDVLDPVLAGTNVFHLAQYNAREFRSAKILYDHTIDLNFSGDAQVSRTVVVPLHNVQMTYIGTGGTLASAEKNHLFLIAVSDRGIGTPCSFGWTEQFVYTDA